MAEALVIARVAALQGEVFARSAEGVVRRLKVGDPVREGDVITPGAGGRVELALQDGTTRLVSSGEQLTVDAEVAGEVKPDAADAALLAGNGQFERVIKAINEGGSLDELLEETAAGEAGGADGGSSFVRLLRIAENVDPLVFRFGSPDRDQFDEPPVGGSAGTGPAAPTISADDGNNVAPGQATVRERGLLSGGDTSETTTGTITVQVPGGVISLSVGGTTFTAAQLGNPAYLAANPVDTGEGLLTVTGYNAATGVLSYSYSLKGPVSQPGVSETIDNIAVSVTSPGGTASTTLGIHIIDSVPQAQNDTNAISEDAAPNTLNGNVFTANDDIGADVVANPVTPTAGTIALSYGSLQLNADGSYTYTLNNANPAVNALKTGQTLSETYTYTITDADGDASTATLVITINGNTDGVPSIVPVDGNGGATGQATVNEQGLTSGGDTSETTTGTITVSAPDGLASIVIGGTTFTAAQLGNPAYLAANPVSTGTGTLTLTGFNPATGALTYTYTLNGAVNQPGATATTDPIPLTVNDLGGDSANGTLTINILDTAPQANPDTNAVTEDTAPNPVSGNVISGTGADTLGADATAVTGIIAGAGVPGNNVTAGTTSANGTNVAGTYGTLVLGANGSYTYTLNNANPAVQALNAGETTTDVFTYTITDADGDVSTTTLTVTLTGTNDLVTVTVPDVSAEAGDLSVREDLTTTGSFTLSAPDGLDPTEAVQIAGTWISKAALEGSGTTNIAITTAQGVLTVTGYNPATGVVSYSYDPSGTAKNHTGGDVLDNIAIVVKDDSGDTANSTLTINILDTNPVANPDVNAVTEDTAPNPVSGNVIATGAGADTLGADATAVTGIMAGAGVPGSNVTAGTTSANGTNVAGTYGTLVLGANGSYTYTLDNANPVVQALARNQAVSDTFSYTITDADGDTSTTTLTITVTGTNDAPDITIGAGDSASAGMTETNAGLTANGTLSIFDIDTQDTVTPSVTGVTAVYSGPGVMPLTNAQLLAMFSVSGGDPSSAGQGVANGIGWNFNSGSQAFNFLPAGQTLTLTYNVRATDSSGAANNTDNQPVTITITGTNDGVVANADTRSIREDESNPANRSGNVLTNDIVDPDLGQTTSVTSFSLDHDGNGIPTTYVPTISGTAVTITSSGGNLGVFTMSSNGNYSFVPQTNYSGPIPVITYTAGSTGGDSATSTLTLTITPVSDAPGVTRDAATVTTNEDVAVALGFNAPTVTDSIDRTGAGAGDNPERLGLISLTGIPRGAILQDTSGNNLYTIPASGSTTVTIRLSDATNLIASPSAATLTMTTAQFEALRLLPPAHSGADITQVRMTVTEYEVDNAGNPLSGVAGANRNANVRVNVLAITDPIDLRINGGNGPHSVTINEDAALNLTSLLSASFQDLDGSERRDIIISNPLGNGTIFVNGNAVAAGGSYTIAWNATGNNLETSQTGFPPISITTAANFSGDLNGITVTLRAQDTDTNAGHTPAILTDSVTLNLYVRPVAGDVSIAAVSTPEDTGVRFLNALTLTDTDGSEAITGITVNAVPVGWVIRDENGVVVFTGTGAAAYTVPAGEVTNGDFRNYTITPAAHNSTDRTLSIAVQTTDTRTVNGSSVTSMTTTNLSQVVTVTAVAERIGVDSNADGTPDLTMNGSFNYSTAGAEDQWFALATDGFNFRSPWTNQDADGSERTFALVTPVLSGGSAIGSQFQYTLGGVTTTLTYTGTPLQIPMDALGTVLFRAAPNVAGSFEIQVQALTIDTDPNGGAPVQTISGSATLTNLVIAPVADPVTLAVDAPAVGNEDSAIPLVIRPSSADPSETFNVTISGIPAGAVIHYNGVVQAVTAGAVTINGFSSSLPLTITPPQNSNVDILLSVSAVSVDTAAALTSVSGATSLPLLVDVRGVADPVTLTVQTLQTSEAVVDAAARRISLAGAVTSVAPTDTDGSESVTLAITGIPSGINVEGLTYIGGTGLNRIWSGTPAQIASAELVVRDAHFSGTINFSIRAVSTENDGNSLTGPTQPVRIEVAPSPEAVIAAQTTVLEDARTPANFALQLPLADGNETLHSVWISEADLAGKPFSLFLGATPLAAAVVADGGWYKLTAAQVANVFIQGAANSDADGSFAIKYEVRDPSSDGSLPATIAQFDATHAVVVNAVTDPTVSTNDYDSSQVIGATTTLEVKVTVTQQDDAAAGGAKDIDGSERLLYFIIDSVPIGVTVEGGRYIGNTPGNPNTGRWILDTPDTPFTVASLEQTIRFALDGTSAQLSNLNQSISIIAHTQDTGGNEQTSTTSWTLRTTPGFIDSDPLPGIPAATITQWVPDPVPAGMTEDAPTPLNELLDAQISGSSPFAVTITSLPAGSVVAGMMQTTIGGQTVWTAQGSGGNASLQALLAGIAITPPPNWNDNQGPFSFSTTLTTYDQGGGRNDASLTLTPPVTAVSDAIDLVTTAVGAAEDAAASISLTLANPEDGAASQVIGGKVYVSVNESGMTANGGVLSVGGVPLATETNPAGLPPGTYYVVPGVGSTSALALQYQGAANASGTMAYTAYVLGQENNATNVTTSQISGSVTISPVTDTVTISAPNVTGSEDQRVPLTIGVTLADPSEAVASVTLSNVPDGVLVFTGAGAPGALAINLGGGNWGLPLVAGAVPAYVALQPPANWSGTISGLQVGVWSGEPGLDPTLTTATVDVTVNGVADGIGLTPTLSFGNEGQIIALNLNSVMPDSDNSETATLTVRGLGQYAAFYAGTALLAAGYDAGTDTYTLTGLTPAQVTGLGVIQKDGSYTLEITAHTVDSPGASTSATVTATLPLNIANVPATSGNDTLLYDGTPLDGLLGVDTIELRLGENIDFATALNPSNIERIDLMPAGENHSLSNLMLQDVLDMAGSGKTLTILGDAGDTVGLKNGAGADQWTQNGTETVGAQVFDVYTNAADAAVKVLIEQSIQRNIDP
ncbi:MAG: retention module-containing protein [Rhodocyclaceae bacterium]|nr:retention module-containing protein [Rhodocyclaceae bacterium]